MAAVTGIGGIFFRSRDPTALSAWYEAHLGITQLWNQSAGQTVFAPFKHDSDYFPAAHQWMINLRVDDLDAMMTQLMAAGIAIETRPDEWDNAGIGRFCRIHDPEGNPIELWEPVPDESS